VVRIIFSKLVRLCFEHIWNYKHMILVNIYLCHRKKNPPSSKKAGCRLRKTKPLLFFDISFRCAVMVLFFIQLHIKLKGIYFNDFIIFLFFLEWLLYHLYFCYFFNLLVNAVAIFFILITWH